MKTKEPWETYAVGGIRDVLRYLYPGRCAGRRMNMPVAGPKAFQIRNHKPCNSLQWQKPLMQAERAVCFPVTKEFREKLYDAIMDCYQQEKEKAMNQGMEQAATQSYARAENRQPDRELPFR